MKPVHVLIVVVVVAVLLAVLLSHGIRLRLFWGSGGFVLGFLCGALITMEMQRRRRAEQKE